MNAASTNNNCVLPAEYLRKWKVHVNNGTLDLPKESCGKLKKRCFSATYAVSTDHPGSKCKDISKIKLRRSPGDILRKTLTNLGQIVQLPPEKFIASVIDGTIRNPGFVGNPIVVTQQDIDSLRRGGIEFLIGEEYLGGHLHMLVFLPVIVTDLPGGEKPNCIIAVAALGNHSQSQGVETHYGVVHTISG